MSASNVVTKRQDELEYVVDKMMTGEVQWGTVEEWLLPSIPSRTTTPSSTPTEPPAHVVAERQVSHSPDPSSQDESSNPGTNSDKIAEALQVKHIISSVTSRQHNVMRHLDRKKLKTE